MKNWFRGLTIGETLVETLHPYRKRWLTILDEMGETARSELAAFRQGDDGLS